MTTTIKAPTNIALIKYWGKKQGYERYNLPTKSSLSLTAEKFYTITSMNSVSGNGNFKLILNGKSYSNDDKEGKYITQFLSNIAEFFPEVQNYDFEIESENNFPTAAGLASSASGFAALAKCLLEELTNVTSLQRAKEESPHLLSVLARLGSGSASRSATQKGGAVLWDRANPSEQDSLSPDKKRKFIFSSTAQSIMSPTDWPELRLMYVLGNINEKKISSRAGMQSTVKTAFFYDQWVQKEENDLLPRMKTALKEKDFESLAALSIQSSNHLHALCLSTTPPMIYLNQTSFDIISAIENLNNNKIIAGYTFDAGPNPVIITTDKHTSTIKNALKFTQKEIVISKVGTGIEKISS